MTTDDSNRRDFLKIGGAALAGAAVSWSAKSYARVAGANDRVGVGVVGCGDRMKDALIPAFHQNAQDMNFEFVAVSDIWSRQRDEGAAYIQKMCSGASHSVASCMNVAAIESGEKVTFDDKTEQAMAGGKPYAG
jgi:hypothetical protein